MSAITFSSKQQLVDALEARRPVLAAIDKANLAEHRKAEKKALATYRARCRAMAKLSYAELKGMNRRDGSSIYFNAPSCPTSYITALDAELRIIQMGSGKRFTIDRGGRWRTVFTLLTVDPTPAPADLCS